ncbi:MAG: hypothetical protein FGM52_09725 [Mycobacterium sp.]|nr:hypothetical protein [Mycobacterium sp.]
MSRVTTRGLAAAGALSAVALLAPGPAAWAAQSFNGTYSLQGGSDEFYSTVTSTCANEGCTASIVSNRGWTSVATLTGGRWVFDVVKPDGVVCADGSYAAVDIRYTVDAATLAGTVTADSNGDCPGGQVTQAPVQLVKVG